MFNLDRFFGRELYLILNRIFFLYTFTTLYIVYCIRINDVVHIGMCNLKIIKYLERNFFYSLLGRANKSEK